MAAGKTVFPIGTLLTVYTAKDEHLLVRVEKTLDVSVTNAGFSGDDADDYLNMLLSMGYVSYVPNVIFYLPALIDHIRASKLTEDKLLALMDTAKCIGHWENIVKSIMTEYGSLPEFYNKVVVQSGWLKNLPLRKPR